MLGYIDPGTGSMLLAPGAIIALLYAGAAVCLFQFRRGCGWLMARLTGRRPEATETGAETAEGEQEAVHRDESGQS